MAKIISIFILKGGTGKTFLTFTMGGFFSSPKKKLGLNKKVLLVDCDPQGSLTKKLVPNSAQLAPTLNHFLSDEIEVPFENCIHNVATLKEKAGQAQKKIEFLKNLDILPLTPNSLRFFRRLGNKVTFNLAEELDSIKNRYDYIFIDCTNQSEVALYLALAASDLVLIPTTCDVEGLECYLNTKDEIGLIAKEINPKLKLLGVVGNLYNVVRKQETFFATKKMPEIISQEGDHYFKTVVQSLSAFKRSIDKKIPVNLLEPPSSQANQIFSALTKEINKKIQQS